VLLRARTGASALKTMEYQAIFEGVIAGDRPGVQALVTAALENDAAAQRLLDEALIPAMGEVGRLFEAGEVYVPEMLVAAHTMQGALDILRPLLAETGAKPIGVVAIGTVQGDLHDIGKNLVGLMLEGAGFEVQDLGTDVKPEKYVEAARNGVQVIGMSALLTTTMPAIERSIAALVEAGIRDSVKVIVGGAPVTAESARQVGADGFASDAASAVRMTKGLLNS
jgi:5-methyltetrahydrofolate--homocysteine methyltransferase